MSRLERQPLRGEKMDEEDRTGDLVEAAILELEAMVEGEGVRWEPLGVDMEEEVTFYPRESEDHSIFEIRAWHGLWWWLCVGRWSISWAVPWLVSKFVKLYAFSGR